MTKKQIKIARKQVQKLIEKNEQALYKKITKKYPKLISLMKKRYDVNRSNLIDPLYYENIEEYLYD